MDLCDELSRIAEDKWCYYEGINFLGYKEAIKNPLEFIESYFYCAGKNKFLYKSLFDFNQRENNEQIKRAKHMVNTFFLGIYIKENIDFHNNKN